MGNDRPLRRHHRSPVQVECKLLRPDASRYVEAGTVDVSDSGALLLVEAGTPLRVGEAVELAIAWDGAELIEAGRTITGRVVRAAGAEVRPQPAAVEFDRPHPRR